MAFFTFTTVSGSAATNNLVYTVASAVAGDVTLSLSSTGTLVYTDVLGNSQDSGYTLANIAPAGMPVVTGTGNVTMTLSTFQTPTLTTKAGGNIATIDAADATAAQVAAFVANHTGAANGSLENASLTAAQFTSLGATVATLGAVAIDATNAVAADWTYMTGAGLGLIAAGAISNADVTATQFAALTTAVASEGKFAAGAATVDGESDVTKTPALITDVVNNQAAVASVSNVDIDKAILEGASFATFAAKVATWGIVSVDATGFTSTDWALVNTYRTIIDQGSVNTVTVAISVADFLRTPGKLADGAVGANLLSLASATSADVDSVIANKAKLASDAVTNASITADQFAGLTTKLANGAATVNASGASDASETAILNYLGKFAAGGLTNLTLSPTQLSTLSAANVALLNTAATSLSVVATEASIITANGYTGTMDITGSDGGDKITTGAGAATVQGAKGSDSITGGASADSLSGGNAADTIIGGGGNDTITGGNSIAAQYFQGDAGNDKFVMNGGNNVIRDLGGVAGGEADILVNSAVVSATVTTVANDVAAWTAASTSSNAGALTLNALAAGGLINLASMGGTVGATVNGGVGEDTITGSVLADKLTTGANTVGNEDTINGGDGNDTITGASGAGTAVLNGDAGNDSITGGSSVETIAGGSGNDTLTGGAGADKFVVSAGAVDTVTDLGAGGEGDILVNAGTVNGTVTGNWTAGAGTDNTGVANITVGNGTVAGGLVVSLAADNTGHNGYTLTAASNTNATTITGSAAGDTITGGTGADSLSGGNGNDSITGGDGNDTLVGGAGTNTLTGGAGNDRFVTSGTDTIVGLTTGDVVVATGTSTASSVSTFVATASSSNTTGALTLNALGSVNAVIDMSLAGGNAGYTVNGGDGADTLTGSAFADSISGGAAIDVIAGGAGNDTITGGAAADVLTGGTGDNTYKYGNNEFVTAETINGSSVAGDDDTILFTADSQTVVDANFANKTYIEAITTANGTNSITLGTAAAAATSSLTVTGGTGVDTINASALGEAVVLVGNGGNDVLTGSSQADTISTGTGNSNVTGLAGADAITLGTGTNTVNYTANAQTVTGAVTSGAAGNVLLADVVVGAGAADILALYTAATVATGDLTAGTTMLTAATAGGAKLVTGAYDSNAGTWTTAAADGTHQDLLVQWADGTSVNSIVLSGDYFSTVTTVKLVGDAATDTFTISAV